MGHSKTEILSMIHVYKPVTWAHASLNYLKQTWHNNIDTIVQSVYIV